jgi:hypothetical protein
MTETEIKREPTTKRVVGVLSAIYFRQTDDLVTGKPIRGPIVAQHGEEIELVASEERRLDQNRALLPKGSKPEDANRYHEERLDAYRAQRGDQEARIRHEQRISQARDSGSVVNVDANVEGAPVSDLAEWIRSEKPNADDTVALAEDDPRKAEKVLEAETVATGGQPRQTVAQRLQKIIDG